MAIYVKHASTWKRADEGNAWTGAAGNPYSLSGEQYSVTGIPSGTREVLVTFTGASHNGASDRSLWFCIGDSGGTELSGYTSWWFDYTGDGTASSTFSYWLLSDDIHYSEFLRGYAYLTADSSVSNKWWIHARMMQAGTGSTLPLRFMNGYKTLSGELDRIIMIAPYEAWDAGTIYVFYR